MARTDDALQILEGMTKDDLDLQDMVREASLNARVAQMFMRRGRKQG